MDAFIAETFADARWFPLRFHVQREEYHFVWAPAEVQRALTFLADLRAGDAQRRIVPRSATGAVPIGEAPLHFILHSGLGGSTLLARALAQPSVVTTLKEPPILTDIVAYRLKAGDDAAGSLSNEVVKLLARPFAPGEAVVVKMNSVGNGLGAAMATNRSTSRILCLQTPLEQMLASLAKRGPEGTSAGRRLFTGLRNSGFAEFGFSEAELSRQSGLELTALAWIAIQRLMVDAAERLGPGQVRSITSNQLFAQPEKSLSAIAWHFGLNLDVPSRLASGVFTRHAKTGEPFSPQAREEELRVLLARHGNEIWPIVEWARKVAEANGVAWDLPYPLLDCAV